MKKNNKIFLAAPFYNYLDENKSVMKTSRVEQITTVMNHLRSKGYEVHNAHEREKWGEDWYGPEECTPLDLEKIKDSDILVAFPGNPASGGVHIELGWASVLGKKIVLLLREEGVYSNLILGLGEVGDVEYIKYNNLADCIQKIGDIL